MFASVLVGKILIRVLFRGIVVPLETEVPPNCFGDS